MQIFVESVLRFHPDSTTFILSDESAHFDFLPQGGSLQILRSPIDQSNLFLDRTRKYRDFTYSHHFNQPTALLDFDIVINRDLSEVFVDTFDVALTCCDYPEEIPINGGVILLNSGDIVAVRRYCDEVVRLHESLNEASNIWWGYQLALRVAAEPLPSPVRPCDFVSSIGVRLRLLPVKTHNYTPFDIDSNQPIPYCLKLADCSKFGEKYILHFKGPRKHLMLQYWDLNKSNTSFPLPFLSSRKPSISVIIPNYNYARFLDACISSVLNQGYQDIELLLIDDCSADNSIEHLQEWANRDSRVRLQLNPKNLGLCTNIQYGLAKIKGEFIVILCADDGLFPGALGSAVNAFAAHDDIPVVYGSSEIVQLDTNHQVIGRKARLVPHNQAGKYSEYATLLVRNYVPTHSVFRRDAMLRHGWRDHMPQASDYDFWLRLAARYPFYYDDQLHGYSNKHEHNYSKQLHRSGAAAAEFRDVYFRQSQDLSIGRSQAEFARIRDVSAYLGTTLFQTLRLVTSGGDDLMARLAREQFIELLYLILDAVTAELRLVKTVGPVIGSKGEVDEIVNILHEVKDARLTQLEPWFGIKTKMVGQSVIPNLPLAST